MCLLLFSPRLGGVGPVTIRNRCLFSHFYLALMLIDFGSSEKTRVAFYMVWNAKETITHWKPVHWRFGTSNRKVLNEFWNFEFLCKSIPYCWTQRPLQRCLVEPNSTHRKHFVLGQVDFPVVVPLGFIHRSLRFNSMCNIMHRIKVNVTNILTEAMVNVHTRQ